ncbi:hypothetical protein Dsin_015332 [Dipteronia sinensis]|uniref:TORTIFOLIA1/SINE1-2 N-terminal domain-containing protein n=1 Tax=Dipteronia sinensis TaxID=43782 RepID=A0AAE0AB17_9ROSI|nr:hypothetical protein Dsin_015332 [Dipteronia sinensis]
MQTILECLRSTDWASCKAATDALTALALHSSNLVVDRVASTLTVLEACRFDKKLAPLQEISMKFLLSFRSLWTS